MAVTVRRIEVSDLELARELRLAALADAPEAFEARLADEQAMFESQWRERIESNAAGIRTVGFFAVAEGQERGLVVGVRPDDRSGSAELVSLWVAPGWRRRGAARALVEAVCNWARGRGLWEVTLVVAETNAAAIKLYRSCGFAASGERRRSRPDPSRWELEMVRPVGPVPPVG